MPQSVANILRVVAAVLAVVMGAYAAFSGGDAAAFGERLALGYGAMIALMAALNVRVGIAAVLGALGCGALALRTPVYHGSVPVLGAGAVCLLLATHAAFKRRAAV